MSSVFTNIPTEEIHEKHPELVSCRHYPCTRSVSSFTAADNFVGLDVGRNQQQTIQRSGSLQARTCPIQTLIV